MKLRYLVIVLALLLLGVFCSRSQTFSIASVRYNTNTFQVYPFGLLSNNIIAFGALTLTQDAFGKVYIGSLTNSGEANTAAPVGNGWILNAGKVGEILQFNTISNDVGLGSSSNNNIITFSLAFDDLPIDTDWDNGANYLVGYSPASNGPVRVLGSSVGGVGGGSTAYEVLTNGVRVAIGTNQNWIVGVTGYVSGSAVNLGVSIPNLSAEVDNLEGASNGLTTRVNNLDGSTNALNTRVVNLDGVTNGLLQGYSNYVRVAAGTGIGVAPSGSANVMTYTVSITDAELLQWAGVGTNFAHEKQFGSAVLTGLVATVANNVTNLRSMSQSNATSKSIVRLPTPTDTNGVSSGTVRVYGLQAGANMSLSVNESNIVLTSSGGTATPGGNDTEAQYNNAGAMDGASGVKIEGETNVLVSGEVFGFGITSSNGFTSLGTVAGNIILSEASANGSDALTIAAMDSYAASKTIKIDLGTTPVAGQVLSIHSYSDPNVIITNATAGAGDVTTAQLLGASNTLNSAIVANDNTTSNALLTAIVANDNTTSNALTTVINTASNTVLRLATTNDNTLYLREDGNDATAVRGDSSKPWRSWTNAVAALTSGDTLLVYPGDYVIGMQSNIINSTLYNKTNVTILGIGRPKLWATNAHKGVFLNLSNAYYITIQGLDFQGSTNRDTSNSGLASAIRFAGSNIAHIVIQDNRLMDWAGNVIVHDDTFRGLSSNVVIRANQFYRTGQWNETASADNVEGSAIAAVGSYSRITDNYFEDVWRGIELENPGTYAVISPLIARNVFNGWKEKGIFNQQSGTADKVQGMMIVDNLMYNWKTNVASHDYAQNFGIADLSSTDTIIARNQIYGARGIAIRITPSASRSNIRPTITDNIITDGGNIGIQLLQAGSTSVITNGSINGNKISYVTNSGIQLSAVGTVVQQNQIYNVALGGGYGIWLLSSSGRYTTNTLIRGNHIEGPDIDVGIGIQSDVGSTRLIGNDIINVVAELDDDSGTTIYGDVSVISGTGGITVSSNITSGRMTFTINDDDAGGSVAGGSGMHFYNNAGANAANSNLYHFPASGITIASNHIGNGAWIFVGPVTNLDHVDFNSTASFNSPSTFSDTLTIDAGGLIKSSADARIGGIVWVTNTVLSVQHKFHSFTNYLTTSSNFVFSFNTNSYVLRNLTNVVFTNLVEEVVGTNTHMVVHVYNDTAVAMGIVWPAYGAQHGYYFRTNANNAILSMTSLAAGAAGVASFNIEGTNIFPTWTVWP